MEEKKNDRGKEGNKKEHTDERIPLPIDIIGRKESKKDTEAEVILMGASEESVSKKEEEAPPTSKEKKQILITEDASKEEKDKEAQSMKLSDFSKSISGKGLNLGRLFLVVTIVFIAFLFLGSRIELLGSVHIAYVQFWPLILIFLGLLLFKVKTPRAKATGTLLVLVIFLFAISILFKGESIVTLALSGQETEETFEVEPFDSVRFEGVGSVTLVHGSESSVTVVGDAAVVPEVQVTHQDGLVTVGFLKPVWSLFLFEDAELDVTIVSPLYEHVAIAGEAELSGEKIKSEELTISISGDGEVVLDDIEVLTLTSRISGSGSIEYSGSTTRQLLHISGSGEYFAEDLTSSEAGIRITGTGDATVDVRDELNISIRGAGNVEYIGNPKITEGDISGSGSIKEKGEDDESEE